MTESLIRMAPVNIAEAAPDYNRERPDSTIVLPRVAGFFLMIAAQHLGTPVMIETGEKTDPKYKAMYPNVMRSLEVQYGPDAAFEARDLALEIIPHYGLGSFERVLKNYIGPSSEELARIESVETANDADKFIKGLKAEQDARSIMNFINFMGPVGDFISSLEAIDDLGR